MGNFNFQYADSSPPAHQKPANTDTCAAPSRLMEKIMDIKPNGPAAEQMLFTDNNHWRVGWGSGLYNFHEQNLPFWVTYGPCRYEPKSFDVEMAVAVRKIAEAAKKPIFVAMSGGLDSELIARIMLQERVTFTPLIVQYDNDYNKDDIGYAFDFCRDHNLTPEIVKIDILSVMSNSINTPYVVANCPSILAMHIMRYCSRLGGMAVTGLGEQRYQQKDGQIVIWTLNRRTALMQFMQAETVQAVPVFYYYTPELMLSFFREAKAHGFEDMAQFAHNIKEDIYRQYWPDLKPRPKYSGFEKVIPQRRAAQKALKQKYGSLITNSAMPIEEFERQLSAGKY
jgi:hypothetical protein